MFWCYIYACECMCDRIKWKFTTVSTVATRTGVSGRFLAQYNHKRGAPLNNISGHTDKETKVAHMFPGILPKTALHWTADRRRQGHPKDHEEEMTACSLTWDQADCRLTALVLSWGSHMYHRDQDWVEWENRPHTPKSPTHPTWGVAGWVAGVGYSCHPPSVPSLPHCHTRPPLVATPATWWHCWSHQVDLPLPALPTPSPCPSDTQRYGWNRCMSWWKEYEWTQLCLF